ncbi:MAG: hypothetical protein NC396_04375 [Bacteroides sp.]|nr:hypothetical protein [Bacteroides sp.]MCM1085595.1 hypothetical protein [Bacteroides sp.]
MTQNMQSSTKKNGLGVAGFVLALLSAIFCWLPVFNFILFGLGLIFSFIGVFKTPRGLAIAGLVISLLALIPIIVLLVGVGAAATLS